MTYGVKLHIWGDYACFTRPEMKVERVSYDIITPSAARGILEAIHWKPAIRWVIDRIHVLNPIRFESIRRNEVISKCSTSKIKSAMRNGSKQELCIYADESDERQQRASTILRNVSYVIEAHIELINPSHLEENIGKHLDIFNRRARKGQCFQQPCMGVREFPVYFSLIENNNIFPKSSISIEQQNRHLGWMFFDFEFGKKWVPKFFDAKLENGIVDLTKLNNKKVKS